MRYATQCLYIIDDRWFPKQSTHLRVGGFCTRSCPFTFQRIEQSGFFTAHIPSDARMQMHFETKATAQNIFSKITGLVCFINCISNYLCSLSISPTQKHIRDICLDCISSEYHSFYQLMRVSFKEQPILESP